VFLIKVYKTSSYFASKKNNFIICCLSLDRISNYQYFFLKNKMVKTKIHFILFSYQCNKGFFMMSLSLVLLCFWDYLHCVCPALPLMLSKSLLLSSLGKKFIVILLIAIEFYCYVSRV
jgi:hypothetical protein